MNPLLAVSGLRAWYPDVHGAKIQVVAGVDLLVQPGEIVGIVGESGCGKSTLAAAIAGVHPHQSGSVLFVGASVGVLGFRTRAPRDRRIQMVFQNPYSTFNPRRKIGAQILDAIKFNAPGTNHTVPEVLRRVGIPAHAADRYPHEFSGGQLQRLAIARALAAKPALIIADEPIAALDASAQLQLAQLFAALVREEKISVLFISHDLSVVSQITDKVAVMYLGKIVEFGPTDTVWTAPAHPYTEALIDAIPFASADQRLPVALAGDVPNPAAPPFGCRFHPRCPKAFDRCSREEPPASLAIGPGRSASCWLHATEHRTAPAG